MAYKTNGVSIGSDHRGLKVKNMIYDYLVPGTDEEATKFNISVIQDHGCYDNKPVDYPDIAKSLCEEVVKFNCIGILVCGTGIGISIAANRNPNIRCALCHSVETAKMARNHNNANVLALGGRVIDEETAKNIFDTFLSEKFEGGRHQRRIDKI